ncbi:hypothetical protein T01_907 [Trichinella spiralis]|uniref:Uncharacterized protein n=1 Tax=Trichinella spiralis TaxID=6334 RepID=A0A0V1BNI8_TRISP|nr:hypothetical protein T01_907 [Trichinella spiralis]
MSSFMPNRTLLPDSDSCIKIDTLGLKGVHVSITNCAYAYCSYVRRHATSVGRLPNRLDVRGGVGEDAREWLLEVHKTQGLTNLASAWGSNYQITATTRRVVRTRSQKVIRGWASESEYAEGSNHDAQFPLKPSVSKLIQKWRTNANIEERDVHCRVNLKQL